MMHVKKKNNPVIMEDASLLVGYIWDVASTQPELIRDTVRAKQSEFASRLQQHNAVTDKPPERRIRSVFDFLYSRNLAIGRIANPIKRSHTQTANTYVPVLAGAARSLGSIYHAPEYCQLDHETATRTANAGSQIEETDAY